MKPQTIQLGGRSGAGTLLLALACALVLAPRPAQAGCGARPGMGRHAASLAGLEALEGVAPPAPFDAGLPVEVPRCSGPSCSNNVPSPPPSGGLEPVPGRGEGLPAPGVVPSAPPGLRPPLPSDERLGPPAEAARVFHPPRRSS